MNFVLIGTDHRMQNSEAGFEGLLRAWLSKKYFEPLEDIAEEYHDKLGPSLGQRLALEHRLRWYNLDMTAEEKAKAGILVEQRSRPISEDYLAYRVPSDEVREAAWVEKLLNSGSRTSLVICGYVHFDCLLKRLRRAGHSVDSRVYLETVPEIRLYCNPNS
jgi:hypothetical protein